MKKIIRFLCSINAAILSMCLWSVSCVGILWFGGEWAFKGFGGGLDSESLGFFEKLVFFENINIKLPSIFMIFSCFLMLCLLCISIKRIVRFKCKIKDISFLINHLGLLILIFFLSLSQINLQKLYCPLYEGQTSSIAMNSQGYTYHLPFSITLLKTWITTDDEIGAGTNESSSAERFGPGPNEEAVNIKNYHSSLKITHDKVHKANISVNHPYSLKEWTLYQYSFYPNSDLMPARSTLLLVRNPWVGGVYCGVILCLLGAFALLFTLKKQASC